MSLEVFGDEGYIAREMEESDYIPYSEYIMAHCGGDRIICNGDTLVAAIEDGYLWTDYLDSLEE